MPGPYTYSEPSPFPPSFADSPAYYGFGLYGDIVAAGVATLILINYALAKRHRRQANHHSEIKSPPIHPRSALGLVHRVMICVWAFIVMRAAPDASWMLLWGEVSEECIRFLLTLDMWLDGLGSWVLLAAAVYWEWGRQAFEQKVFYVCQNREVGRLSWRILLGKLKLVIGLMIIAGGVSWGKLLYREY